MDLNGLKGPNIIGRDLIEWTNLPAINDYAPDRSSGAHPIIAENESPITPIQAPECTSITSDASTGCCKWKREHGMITGKVMSAAGIRQLAVLFQLVLIKSKYI